MPLFPNFFGKSKKSKDKVAHMIPENDHGSNTTHKENKQASPGKKHTPIFRLKKEKKLKTTPQKTEHSKDKKKSKKKKTSKSEPVQKAIVSVVTDDSGDGSQSSISHHDAKVTRNTTDSYKRDSRTTTEEDSTNDSSDNYSVGVASDKQENLELPGSAGGAPAGTPSTPSSGNIMSTRETSVPVETPVSTSSNTKTPSMSGENGSPRARIVRNATGDPEDSPRALPPGNPDQPPSTASETGVNSRHSHMPRGFQVEQDKKARRKSYGDERSPRGKDSKSDTRLPRTPEQKEMADKRQWSFKKLKNFASRKGKSEGESSRNTPEKRISQTPEKDISRHSVGIAFDHHGNLQLLSDKGVQPVELSRKVVAKEGGKTTQKIVVRAHRSNSESRRPRKSSSLTEIEEEPLSCENNESTTNPNRNSSVKRKHDNRKSDSDLLRKRDEKALSRKSRDEICMSQPVSPPDAFFASPAKKGKVKKQNDREKSPRSSLPDVTKESNPIGVAFDRQGNLTLLSDKGVPVEIMKSTRVANHGGTANVSPDKTGTTGTPTYTTQKSPSKERSRNKQHSYPNIEHRFSTERVASGKLLRSMIFSDESKPIAGLQPDATLDEKVRKFFSTSNIDTCAPLNQSLPMSSKSFEAVRSTPNDLNSLPQKRNTISPSTSDSSDSGKNELNGSTNVSRIPGSRRSLGSPKKNTVRVPFTGTKVPTEEVSLTFYFVDGGVSAKRKTSAVTSYSGSLDTIEETRELFFNYGIRNSDSSDVTNSVKEDESTVSSLDMVIPTQECDSTDEHALMSPILVPDNASTTDNIETQELDEEHLGTNLTVDSAQTENNDTVTVEQPPGVNQVATSGWIPGRPANDDVESNQSITDVCSKGSDVESLHGEEKVSGDDNDVSSKDQHSTLYVCPEATYAEQNHQDEMLVPEMLSSKTDLSTENVVERQIMSDKLVKEDKQSEKGKEHFHFDLNGPSEVKDVEKTMKPSQDSHIHENGQSTDNTRKADFAQISTNVEGISPETQDNEDEVPMGSRTTGDEISVEETQDTEAIFAGKDDDDLIDVENHDPGNTNASDTKILPEEAKAIDEVPDSEDEASEKVIPDNAVYVAVKDNDISSDTKPQSIMDTPDNDTRSMTPEEQQEDQDEVIDDSVTSEDDGSLTATPDADAIIDVVETKTLDNTNADGGDGSEDENVEPITSIAECPTLCSMPGDVPIMGQPEKENIPDDTTADPVSVRTSTPCDEEQKEDSYEVQSQCPSEILLDSGNPQVKTKADSSVSSDDEELQSEVPDILEADCQVLCSSPPDTKTSQVSANKPEEPDEETRDVPVNKPEEPAMKTPEMLVNKPQECARDTPEIPANRPEESDQEAPEVLADKPEEPSRETPEVLADKPEEPARETPEVPANSPDEFDQEAPEVPADKPEEPSRETPEILAENPEESDREAPEVLADKPEEPSRETPEVLADKPEEPARETPEVPANSPDEFDQEAPEVPADKPEEPSRESPEVPAENPEESDQEAPEVLANKPEEPSGEIPEEPADNPEESDQTAPEVLPPPAPVKRAWPSPPRAVAAAAAVGVASVAIGFLLKFLMFI